MDVHTIRTTMEMKLIAKFRFNIARAIQNLKSFGDAKIFGDMNMIVAI